LKFFISFEDVYMELNLCIYYTAGQCRLVQVSA
jgi:hypothetical protein